MSVGVLGSASGFLRCTMNSTTRTIANQTMGTDRTLFGATIPFDLGSADYNGQYTSSLTSVTTPFASWSSTQPSTITILIPGRYLFMANVEYAPNSTGQRNAWIYAEKGVFSELGVTTVNAAGGSQPTSLCVSSVVTRISSNDAPPVQVHCYTAQNSGGALGIGQTGMTYFQVVYLGGI